MKKLMTRTLICSAAAAGLFLAAQGTADAAMTGKCSACHTMHNSQNGINMTSGAITAQDFLLVTENTCIGCHSGPTAQGMLNDSYSAPIVIHTDAPDYDPTANPTPTDDTLAGGDFYWVTQGNQYGHNVAEISGISADSTLSNEAPGDADNTWNQAFAIGCEDCHVGGGHHANTTGTCLTTSTPGTPATSYRFLTGGVIGCEDTDWEWVVTSESHNVYFADTVPELDANRDATTINGFCAGCHGGFHGAYETDQLQGQGSPSSTQASPWRRHPTDIKVLDKGTEYASYNTNSGNKLVYAPQSPVGVSGTPAPFSTVADTQDVVVCLSCHRAHGSPYADMLRWSYDMEAGSASDSNGCFVCHTQKGNGW